MKIKFKLRDDDKSTIETLPEEPQAEESTEKKKKTKAEIFADFKQELANFNQQININNPAVSGTFNIFINNILAKDYGSTDFYEGDYNIQAWNRVINLFKDSSDDALIDKSKVKSSSDNSKDEHGLHLSLVRKLISAQNEFVKNNKDNNFDNLAFNSHALPKMMPKKFIYKNGSLTHRENTSSLGDMVAPYMIEGKNGEKVDSGARIVNVPYHFISKLPKNYIKAINKISDNDKLLKHKLGVFVDNESDDKDVLNVERLFDNISFIDITLTVKYYYYAFDEDTDAPTKKEAIVNSKNGNIVTRFGEVLKKKEVKNIYGDKEKSKTGGMPTIKAPAQSAEGADVRNKITYDITAKGVGFIESKQSNELYGVKTINDMCNDIMSDINSLIGKLKSDIMIDNNTLSEKATDYANKLITSHLDTKYENNLKYNLLKDPNLSIKKTKSGNYVISSGKAVDNFNDLVLNSAVNKLNKGYETDIFETSNVKCFIKMNEDKNDYRAIVLVHPNKDLEEDLKTSENYKYIDKPFKLQCEAVKKEFTKPVNFNNIVFGNFKLISSPLERKKFEEE